MSASLNNIVDVTVQVSSPSAISSDFNLGLIIAPYKESLGGTINEYSYNSYQTQMVGDGYATTDDAYKKAVIYFSQNPKSSRLLVASLNNGEASSEGFTRIRSANDKFYSFCFASTLTDEDIAAVAAVVESASVPTVFYFASTDSNIITAGTSNIFKTLQDGSYSRTFGFYSSDTNIDAAMVGLVSGLNSMRANSAYTAAYKALAGITPTTLNDTQLSTVVGYNGNVYTAFGNSYNFTYPAISFGNYHVDDLFLIDAAEFLIQQEVVAGLTSVRKVPQTEAGVDMITSFIANACNTLNNIGLISGGIWTGQPIQNLSTGDAVENGFSIQAGSIYEQTASEKASRISPPFYVALVASGAIEHVVIQVFVNK